MTPEAQRRKTYDFKEILSGLRRQAAPEQPSRKKVELNQLAPTLMTDIAHKAADLYHLEEGKPSGNLLRLGNTKKLSLEGDDILCGIEAFPDQTFLITLRKNEDKNEEVAYQVSFTSRGGNEWELLYFHSEPNCEDPMKSGAVSVLLDGVEKFIKRLADHRQAKQRLKVNENQLHILTMLLNRKYEAVNQEKLNRVLEGDSRLEVRDLIKGEEGATIEELYVLHEGDEEFDLDLVGEFVPTGEIAPEIAKTTAEIRAEYTRVIAGGRCGSEPGPGIAKSIPMGA